MTVVVLVTDGGAAIVVLDGGAIWGVLTAEPSACEPTGYAARWPISLRMWRS